jgi:hypothetical protein
MSDDGNELQLLRHASGIRWPWSAPCCHMETINMDPAVISRDKHLAVGHDWRAELAVIEVIIRNVVAVPQQL